MDEQRKLRLIAAIAQFQKNAYELLVANGVDPAEAMAICEAAKAGTPPSNPKLQ